MTKPTDEQAHAVVRPVRPGWYEVGARNAKVAAEWAELCRQAPGECNRVYDTLEQSPLTVQSGRQHPLHDAAGRVSYRGAQYQRWQIDVTSGGRVWYFVIETETGAGHRRRAGQVVIDHVAPGHPKSTEKRKGGKRRPGRK